PAGVEYQGFAVAGGHATTVGRDLNYQEQFIRRAATPTHNLARRFHQRRGGSVLVAAHGELDGSKSRALVSDPGVAPGKTLFPDGRTGGKVNDIHARSSSQRYRSLRAHRSLRHLQSIDPGHSRDAGNRDSDTLCANSARESARKSLR